MTTPRQDKPSSAERWLSRIIIRWLLPMTGGAGFVQMIILKDGADPWRIIASGTALGLWPISVVLERLRPPGGGQ
jgi:hypothetical protein